MSHVTLMQESCLTHMTTLCLIITLFTAGSAKVLCATKHTNESRHTHERVVSHTHEHVLSHALDSLLQDSLLQAVASRVRHETYE